MKNHANPDSGGPLPNELLLAYSRALVIAANRLASLALSPEEAMSWTLEMITVVDIGPSTKQNVRVNPFTLTFLNHSGVGVDGELSSTAIGETPVTLKSTHLVNSASASKVVVKQRRIHLHDVWISIYCTKQQHNDFWRQRHADR